MNILIYKEKIILDFKLGQNRKDILLALKKNNTQVISSNIKNELHDFIEPLGPFIYYDINYNVNAIEVASNTDIEIVLNNKDLFRLQYKEIVNKLTKLSSDYDIEDSYHAVFYDLGIGVANDSDSDKPSSLIIFNDKYYKR